MFMSDMGGGGDWAPEGGLAWNQDAPGISPEQQLAAVPPAQRSVLMRLLGGIGDVMSAPRRMMWDAFGWSPTGAEMMANRLGGSSDDTLNQLLGFGAEAVLDPVSLGLGAGGALARVMGRAANAGGAGRLAGLVANDARAIDMTNDARQMAASMGRIDDVGAGLGGAMPRGTMMPQPQMPFPPTPAAPEVLGGYNAEQLAAVAGGSPEMFAVGGAARAMPYKRVNAQVSPLLQQMGFMDETGQMAGALPPFAQVRGGSVMPNPEMADVVGNLRDIAGLNAYQPGASVARFGDRMNRLMGM